MLTQTHLAAALLLTALTATAAQADPAADATLECSFATHADYLAMDSKLAKSKGGAVRLTDVCDAVKIDLPTASDPCSDYDATYRVSWAFYVGGLARDPIVNSAVYWATATTSETWTKSGSYCVLTSTECDIEVTDGSRFHHEWFTHTGYGSHEVTWGQYKQLALSDVRVSCRTLEASGAVAPGVYVYGSKE
ncbi:MAG: hypothetical protein QOD77_1926 [Thermoplasmata archaeon]|jgi:hypothetical protein|nr:hypothetical protein [Thermoplasmata archaeon]